MVGRQPFGGNRRSGIGSKAGGPDYLLQFVEPRVVTENTMRHGLRGGLTNLSCKTAGAALRVSAWVPSPALPHWRFCSSA